jgi:hypothetical protein
VRTITLLIRLAEANKTVLKRESLRFENLQISRWSASTGIGNSLGIFNSADSRSTII